MLSSRLLLSHSPIIDAVIKVLTALAPPEEVVRVELPLNALVVSLCIRNTPDDD